MEEPKEEKRRFLAYGKWEAVPCIGTWHRIRCEAKHENKVKEAVRRDGLDDSQEQGGESEERILGGVHLQQARR